MGASRNRAERGSGGSSVAAGLLSWIAAGAILAGFVVAVYQPSLENGYHFDDQQNIYDNPAVRIESLSLGSLRRAATESPLSRRPLPYVTFAIDWYRGNGSPRAFQWTNISLHAINAVLVLILLSSVLCLWRGGFDLRSLLAACGGSALWAAHPIQVQAVTYIVQRMAAMATGFTLVAVIAYLGARVRRARAAQLAFLGACLLATLAASASKEIGWISPALILLAELGLVRHRRPWFRSRTQRRLALLALPPLALAATWMVSGAGSLSPIVEGYEFRSFSMTERLLTQPRVIAFHVSQMTWPAPDRFSLEHDFPISRSLLDPPSTTPSLALLLAWCGFGAWLLARRGRRLFGFLVLWLPTTLAIESTFVPLEIVFEHRMYLPSVGMAGLVALGLDQAFRRSPKPGITVMLPTLAAVALLASSSIAYLSVWRDPVGLGENAVRHAPGSARSWANLGLAYLKQGRLEAAEPAIARSLAIEPGNRRALELIGILSLDRGRLGDARNYLNRALAVGPTSAGLLNHLGEVELASGFPDKAAELFLRATRMKPWVATYHWNRALALERLGQCREARGEWSEYLRLSTDAASTREVRQHLEEVHFSVDGACFESPR